MPAPAVYVLAIVGTVGAVLAFKEFVYEPHIAPAIDRWKLEYAARRRRQAAVPSTSEEDREVPMQERRTSPKGKQQRSSGKYSDDGDDVSSGGNANHSLTKDGLLSGKDGEMDALVAREVDEWRREIASSTAQDLRQRKNVSGHALDESIHAIPYAPLSPTRTHVLFDGSGSPSPSTTSSIASRLPSAPGSPIPRQSGADHAGGFALPPTPTSPGGNRSISGLNSSPSMRRVVSEGQSGSRAPSASLTGASSSSLHAHDRLASVPAPGPGPSGAAAGVQQQRPSAYVPSLSQSYPQDLDYEHGLELLSPPSSRSESPFSILADVSPNPAALVRLSSSSSSQSSSASVASSNVSSPLRMGLGNESFHTLSPIERQSELGGGGGVDAQAHLSPFRDPLEPSASVTNSARSTAYLSFASDDDDDVPLGLSHGAHSRPSSSGSQHAADQTLLFSGPPPSFTSPSPSMATATTFPIQQPSSSSTQPTHLRLLSTPNIMHTPAQSDLSELSDLDFMSESESEYAPPSEGEGEVVVVDVPRVLSASSMGSPRSEHGPSHQVQQNERNAYETDSDASWSVAGGSDAGAGNSPRMGGGASTSGTGGSNLTRGGTVRASDADAAAARFGWRR